ncbi:MAG: lysophospholipid acyltransferase family protein [Candidatus Dormibacteraeota bacterium]|nr:lysophospholipid acyltransferase family protein [Candidatus Dormibacteraeota bacterium]
MSAPQTSPPASGLRPPATPASRQAPRPEESGRPGLTWYGFHSAQRLVAALPRSVAYALAIVAARFAFVFARGARRALAENLRVALPERTPGQLRLIAWRNFRNHAKAYVDLMQMPVAEVEDLKPLLHRCGEDLLAEARALGKGVLMVSCHMGSWEVAAASWAVTTAPVNLFAEVLEPQEMYDWYRTTRARLGISVLPLNRSGLRKVLQALDENELVITALDRDILGTGIECDFFGHRARIPDGVATIALHRGVPIMPVCVYRLPDDTYRGVGYQPIYARPTGDDKADVRRITQLLVRCMEQMIREHPDQWHLPHRIFDLEDSRQR